MSWDLLWQNSLAQIGGVRWGSNNYHHDHPLFTEYISNRLGVNTDSREREGLVKAWEDFMIHNLNPLRRHATNTSFGGGEKYEDLQVEFNMWVCMALILNHPPGRAELVHLFFSSSFSFERVYICPYKDH